MSEYLDCFLVQHFHSINTSIQLKVLLKQLLVIEKHYKNIDQLFFGNSVQINSVYFTD